MSGLLEHVGRDSTLRRRHGGAICKQLLSKWSSLATWWAEPASTDLKLGAVDVLNKMLSMEPKVGTVVSWLA